MERGGIGVHAVAGGGTGRADGFARPGGRRADVIDELPFDVDRQLLARLDELDELLVGGIPSGQEVAGDEDLVAGSEFGDGLVVEREGSANLNAPLSIPRRFFGRPDKPGLPQNDMHWSDPISLPAYAVIRDDRQG